ncbi:hypothetical protein Z957_04140 [Clostridium sp. K25]|uniref:hypothetical protein n=1 Tax=Clostridium sp. K25 TaxID=1443109 RepID=UPI0004D8FCF5|nr:hypothetical protein [Clostridium sp. K25]KEI09690.1 hypothetical protein Z957_04140 [Clostridium sp. K25]
MGSYFSKLPNKLFYAKDKEDKSILLECNNDFKSLMVLDYLYTYTTRNNLTVFILEDLIITSGYKPNRSKGQTNEQFKNILVKLQELKIIDSTIDMNNIKPSQFIKCTLDLFNKDSKNNDVEFIQLYDYEKDKILQCVYDLDRIRLLFYYCYIKSRIYRRVKGNDMVIYGGRAEVCFPSYQMIKYDLGLSDGVIDKYNNILSELDMIRIDNAGLWYYKSDKNKVVRESPNFYTLYTEQEEVWKNNLKEAIKYYKKSDINRDKVFTNTRQYKNNNKNINGFISRVEQLKREGKATPEQLEKLSEYKKSIHEDSTIETLLNQNVNIPLSEIYMNYFNSSKSDKYYDLENELGLIDNDGYLIVEWDYYKWVMINYTDDKKDYYINCINKHIKDKESKIKHIGLRNL